MSEINPIPDGFAGVIPYVGVRRAAEAIEFYKEAFGAVEVMRLVDPQGSIAHAELKIGGSLVMLAEESEEWGNHSPRTLGGTPVRLHLYVDDVDAVVHKAVEAGAVLQVPVQDQFYGDRTGRIEDPHGHVWIVSTHVEDVSAEEMQKRADALFGAS